MRLIRLIEDIPTIIVGVWLFIIIEFSLLPLWLFLRFLLIFVVVLLHLDFSLYYEWNQISLRFLIKFWTLREYMIGFIADVTFE